MVNYREQMQAVSVLLDKLLVEMYGMQAKVEYSRMPSLDLCRFYVQRKNGQQYRLFVPGVCFDDYLLEVLLEKAEQDFIPLMMSNPNATVQVKSDLTMELKD